MITQEQLTELGFDEDNEIEFKHFCLMYNEIGEFNEVCVCYHLYITVTMLKQNITYAQLKDLVETFKRLEF